MADPEKPSQENGENKGESQQQSQTEPKWKELGFESEDALIEAAKGATELRREIKEKEAELEKELKAKKKTNDDYLKQSNEIGKLRKKLEEQEKKTGASTETTDPNASQSPKETESDDDVIASISNDEALEFDKVLDAPENIELAKLVKSRGIPALAEFVRNYRKEKGVAQPQTSVFSSLIKKKQESVPISSISKTVKALFHKENDQTRNSLAAVPHGGAPADRLGSKNTKPVYGGVTTAFFEKKK